MKAVWRLALVLGAILGVSMVVTQQAQAAPRAPLLPAASGATWDFVGDSITHGLYATTQAQRFSDLVSQQLGVNEINNSLAGKVADILSALPAFPRADVTVIELGTNDYSGFNPNGTFIPTPLQAFRGEYATLLKRAVRVSPFVMCLGVWQPRNSPNSIGVLAEAYDQVIWSLCPHYGDLQALFANGAYHGPAGRSTWLGPADDFHPNDAGHAAIATEVESVARAGFPVAPICGVPCVSPGPLTPNGTASCTECSTTLMTCELSVDQACSAGETPRRFGGLLSRSAVGPPARHYPLAEDFLGRLLAKEQ